MTLAATTFANIILAHPVDLPMKLRTPRGLFGAHRQNKARPHEGIDLLVPVGSPVYAVGEGTVLKAEPISGNPDNQRIIIDHSDEGSALISRYLHLNSVDVSSADHVGVAEEIGTVGPGSPPHLHFELRLVLNNSDSSKYHYKRRSLPLDPTREMYRWEAEYSGYPNTMAAHQVTEFSIMFKGGVRMAQIRWDSKWYHLPLYQPTPDELGLAELLRQAFMKESSVRLAARESVFFKDRNVITAARVVG